MIVAAAIRFPAMPDPYKPTVQDLIMFVPKPGRHHNVLHSLHHQFKYGGERTSESYFGEEQGFLTDTGLFLNREAAYGHVLSCGQEMIVHGSNIAGTLYSEDLW